MAWLSGSLGERTWDHCWPHWERQGGLQELLLRIRIPNSTKGLKPLRQSSNSHSGFKSHCTAQKHRLQSQSETVNSTATSCLSGFSSQFLDAMTLMTQILGHWEPGTTFQELSGIWIFSRYQALILRSWHSVYQWVISWCQVGRNDTHPWGSRGPGPSGRGETASWWLVCFVLSALENVRGLFPAGTGSHRSPGLFIPKEALWSCPQGHVAGPEAWPQSYLQSCCTSSCLAPPTHL